MPHLPQFAVAMALTTLFALPLSTAPLQNPQDQKPAPRIRTVAIVLFPGVELLDFAGPGEVFAGCHDKDGMGFRVVTVAESKEPMKSMGFLKIVPEFTLADCPKADIVVVPGGNVPASSEPLRKWIQARAQDTELMMSVCNGALVLANAGLLKGLDVTTHKSALQGVALAEPTARVLTNRRFIDNGRVMTSAGISAGIDGALHVIERFGGADMAWDTARYMEYDWRPDELARLHAQPGTPIEGAEAIQLVGSIRKLGIPATIEALNKLEKKPSEGHLNKWAYGMLRSGRTDDAVELFRLITVAYPQSSNAMDSLSEALESKNDFAAAKQAAEECLGRLAKEAGLDADTKKMLRNSAGSRIARLSNATKAQMPFVCPPCNMDCDKLAFLEGGKCPNCAMELVEREK